MTVEYRKEGGAVIPVRVHTILISTQHSPDVTNETIHKELMEHVIKPVVPEKYLDEQTIFHLNPSGGCLQVVFDIEYQFRQLLIGFGLLVGVAAMDCWEASRARELPGGADHLPPRSIRCDECFGQSPAGDDMTC